MTRATDPGGWEVVGEADSGEASSGVMAATPDDVTVSIGVRAGTSARAPRTRWGYVAASVPA